MDGQGELFGYDPAEKGQREREKIVDELKAAHADEADRLQAVHEAVDAQIADLPPLEQAEARVAHHVDAADAERDAINADVSPARIEETGTLATDTATGPLAVEAAGEARGTEFTNSKVVELNAGAAASREQFARLREQGILPPIDDSPRGKLSARGKANMDDTLSSADAHRLEREAAARAAAAPNRLDTVAKTADWIRRYQDEHGGENEVVEPEPDQPK